MTAKERLRLFNQWRNAMFIAFDDEGQLLMNYPDGGEIELVSDPADGRAFGVRIGNQEHWFKTHHAAEWHLWDNWSECNHI